MCYRTQKQGKAGENAYIVFSPAAIAYKIFLLNYSYKYLNAG